jgi:hypothetical protein
MAESCYKEALHRSASAADLSESLGVPTTQAHKVIKRFHRAYPNRREAYERWRSAKAQSEDPTQLLFKGLRMAAGAKREPGDTVGDGGEFLSDLLGGGGGR